MEGLPKTGTSEIVDTHVLERTQPVVEVTNVARRAAEDESLRSVATAMVANWNPVDFIKFASFPATSRRSHGRNDAPRYMTRSGRVMCVVGGSQLLGNRQYISPVSESLVL